MSIINLTPEEKDTSLSDTQEISTELPVEDSSEPSEPTEKTVVMDGPLSKIYTQALNLVYAHEAASASGQTDIKVLFNEQTEEESVKDLYVYCCDGSELDSEDVIEGTNKLRLALDGRYKNTLVVMESHAAIKPIAGLFEQYAATSGIRVIFQRENALEAIHQLLL